MVKYLIQRCVMFVSLTMKVMRLIREVSISIRNPSLSNLLKIHITHSHYFLKINLKLNLTEWREIEYLFPKLTTKYLSQLRSIAMRVKIKRQKSRQTLHSKSKLKSMAQQARSTYSLPQPHSLPWSRSTKIYRKLSMTKPKPCIPDTTPKSLRSPRISQLRRGRRSC